MIHIFETPGKKYICTETFLINNHTVSKVLYETNNIDLAKKFVIIYNEDAIPVNNISGSNISTVAPVMKFRQGIFKRIKQLRNRTKK